MFPVLRSSLLAVVSLLILSSELPAQGNWSAEFDQPGLLGRVFAVGTFQGDIVAGGYGVQADGHPTFGLTSRFDGTHWQPMGSGISSGNLQFVAEFAEYQGALFAGGRFCCAGGQSTSSIARWDGNQWSALGSGVAGIVRAMVVYQGELIVAGEFTSAGGIPALNIARWNGTTWQPVGGGLHKSYDPEVHDLVVGSDGKLYASGEFDTAGGLTVNNVAVWDGTSWSAMANGLPGALNARVYSLAWYQGQVYAGGNYDLTAGGADHEKLAVWDGSTWSAAGVFPDGAITGNAIESMTVIGTDLYVCGNIVEVNGISLNRMARFDGTQWHATGGVAGSDVQTVIYSTVEHGGKLIVGGEFSQIGNTLGPGLSTVSHSVGSYDGANWAGIGKGLGLNASANDGVLWNGGLVAVGSFTEAGSQFVQGSNLWPGPVFYDGTDWSSMVDVYGQVRTVAVWNNDLIIAGSFTKVNGQSIQGVARFDGVQWTGFGSGFSVSADRAALAVYRNQLYAGGTGGVMRWNGSTWESFAPQLYGHVNDLHVYQDVLYIGGSIAGNLVSWDGTTQQTVAGGASDRVSCFETFEGDLIIGGSFASAGGVTANRLARWNGTTMSEFPGISGTLVSALAVFQGELYASGNLIMPGLPANKYVARWDGNSWAAMGEGFGSGGQANTLIADDLGGHLYAGGIIATAGGNPARYFASWDTAPVVVGTPYCFGDGSGTICPCGNLSVETGHGCANSAFASGARLYASGVASVLIDTLELHATSTAPGTPGLFFQGTQQANSGAGVILGDGLLCANGQIRRLRVRFANGFGDVGSGTGLALRGGVTAGSTLNYQWWYRDPTGSPCGHGFNLSNGLSIVWQP